MVVDARELYSYPKGIYTSFRDFTSGIIPAIGKAATWNDIVKFESELENAMKYGYELQIEGFTSPLTTKGDLLGYSTTNVRVPVGTFEQALIADSVASVGIRWSDKYWFPNAFRRWTFVHGSNSTGPAITVTVDGSVIGTLTREGTETRLQDATGNYLNYATTTSLDADAGHIFGDDCIYRAWGTMRFDVMKTGGLSTSSENCRIWVGLFEGDPMASSAPSIDYMAFRYATDVDGTAFWRAVTDDGSGTPTATTTSVAITTDTRYELRIDCSDSSSVKFYIDNVLVATHTTTLPGTTTALRAVAEIRNLTAGTARAIRLAKTMLVYD